MTSSSEPKHYSPKLYLDAPDSRKLERMIHYHQDVLDTYIELSELMDDDAAIDRIAQLCLNRLMTESEALSAKQELFAAVDKLCELKASITSAVLAANNDIAASAAESADCNDVEASISAASVRRNDIKDAAASFVLPCGDTGRALQRWYVQAIEQNVATMNARDAFANLAMALVSSSLTLSDYYALHLKIAQDSCNLIHFPTTLLSAHTASMLDNIMSEACAHHELHLAQATIIADAIATQAEGLANLTAALLDEKDESYRELLSVSVIANPTAAKTLMLEQDVHIKKLTALVLYSMSYAATAKIYSQNAPIVFYACLADYLIEQMRVQACNAVQRLNHEDTAVLMLQSYLKTIAGALVLASYDERESIIASILAYPTITLTTGMLFNLNNAGLSKEQKRHKANRFQTYRPSLKDLLCSWLRTIFK